MRADSMVSSREIWAEFRATEVKLRRPASSPVRPSAFTIPLYAVSHPCSLGFLSRAAFLARKRAPAHPPISDGWADSGPATVAIVRRCIYACSFRPDSLFAFPLPRWLLPSFSRFEWIRFHDIYIYTECF